MLRACGLGVAMFVVMAIGASAIAGVAGGVVRAECSEAMPTRPSLPAGAIVLAGMGAALTLRRQKN